MILRLDSPGESKSGTAATSRLLTPLRSGSRDGSDGDLTFVA
jgi:hypothetical protein